MYSMLIWSILISVEKWSRNVWRTSLGEDCRMKKSVSYWNGVRCVGHGQVSLSGTEQVCSPVSVGYFESWYWPSTTRLFKKRAAEACLWKRVVEASSGGEVWRGEGKVFCKVIDLRWLPWRGLGRGGGKPTI